MNRQQRRAAERIARRRARGAQADATIQDEPMAEDQGQGVVPMQTFAPAPVPCRVTPEMPEGAEVVVLLVSTPQTPIQALYISQEDARDIGAKLVEMGERRVIVRATSMPGLIVPGR